MAIETTAGGGMMITGKEDINLFRLTSLKGRLKMEIAGMTCRGPSAATLIKKEFGFKGNNKKVLEQFEAKIEELKAARSKGE